MDLDEVARAIIDGNRYMVLGTADEGGRPWVSPVYYAPSGYSELFPGRPGGVHRVREGVPRGERRHPPRLRRRGHRGHAQPVEVHARRSRHRRRRLLPSRGRQGRGALGRVAAVPRGGGEPPPDVLVGNEGDRGLDSLARQVATTPILDVVASCSILADQAPADPTEPRPPRRIGQPLA